MAEQERPAVGSVAEEAARLLDALGGWASTVHTSYAAQPAGSATPPGSPGPDEDLAEPPDQASGGTTGEPGRCGYCGAMNGEGQAASCQLCPVCQGIGLLRAVRPETVDRLADLAGALAVALRDIARARRTRAGTGPTTPTPSGNGVQDIRVEDEDEQAGSATS